MARVLVIDNNAEFREIISRKLAFLFDTRVSVTPFCADTPKFLEADGLCLVISDVEDSISQGFWVHNYLRKFRPKVALAVFVDEHRLLRNIPQFDSTVRIAVSKPDFRKLCAEIKRLGLLRSKLNHAAMPGHSELEDANGK